MFIKSPWLEAQVVQELHARRQHATSAIERVTGSPFRFFFPLTSSKALVSTVYVLWVLASSANLATKTSFCTLGRAGRF